MMLATHVGEKCPAGAARDKLRLQINLGGSWLAGLAAMAGMAWLA